MITVSFDAQPADLNDFCVMHGYTGFNGTPPVAETKLQFFVRKTREIVWASVHRLRRARVTDAAGATQDAIKVEF